MESTPTAGIKKDVQLRLERVLLDSSQPTVAHHVSMVRVGDEVLLEVGNYDLVMLRQQLIARKDEVNPVIELPLFITGRFVLSLDATNRVLASISEFETKFKKSMEEVVEK